VPQGGVPFCCQYRSGAEMGYIEQAVTSADTRFVEQCSEWLARLTGKEALLTPSCSAALEMAAILANVGPGDEVIVPSYTFATSASAFVLLGATVVFADIRADTLNLDPESVAAAITPRTKVIVVVHYAGVGCDMNALTRLAEQNGLILVEDCAHAILATYEGKPLGCFGQMATFSFHHTKNLTCGEGGALCVSRDCAALWPRARVIWDKGTNRHNFLEGKIDKYEWVDKGSSFVLSEVCAAFLLAQLEAADEITKKRISLWKRYHELLGPLEARGFLRRPVVPEECNHNAHMYFILLPSGRVCTHVRQRLHDAGIQANSHYAPLHTSPAGLRFGRVGRACSVAEDVADRILRLPLWPMLSEKDVCFVVKTLEGGEASTDGIGPQQSSSSRECEAHPVDVSSPHTS